MPLPDDEEFFDSCPLCETRQKFTRQLRDSDNGVYLIEFWSCRVCPWKREGAPSTRPLERLRRQYREAQVRTEKEVRRYGQPSVSTVLMKKRIRERMIGELESLRELVNAA